MGRTEFTLVVYTTSSEEIATLSITYEVGDVSFGSLKCGETNGVS